MSGTFKTIGAVASIAFVLAGCAQQQSEPLVITPQPIFNKFGEAVGCEGDATYNPNNEEYPCEPPECQEYDAQGVPCPPPGREPDDPDRNPNPQIPSPVAGQP